MKHFILVATIFFTFSICNLLAQWQLVGNYFLGKQTYSVFATGEYLFAGTDCGLFRSSDKGFTWTKDGHWNHGQIIVSSIIKNKDVLFAATRSEGVFSSTDDGDTWTKKCTDLDTIAVITLTPWKDTLFAGTNHGVYISTNQGANWQARNSGIEKMVVVSILATDSYIFAGTDGSGFIRSRDGGTSWERKNEGLRSTTTKDKTVLYAIGLQRNRLFAGSINSYFYSDDNGDSWTERIVEGYEGYNKPITSVFATDSIVYLGAISQVLCSRDNGTTWYPTGLNTIEGLVEGFSSNGSFLYAAGESGDIYYKLDASEEWNMLNTRTTRSYIGAFILYDNKMMLGMNNSTFTSTDLGCTWKEANKDIHFSFSCFASRGIDLWGGAIGGIYTTSDDGANWTDIAQKNNLRYVEFMKWHDGKIYAGTLYGLVVSGDEGQTWNTLRTDSTGIYDAENIAFDGNHIYVRTNHWGFFESFDNGTTWSSTKLGLDSVELTSVGIWNRDDCVLIRGDTLGKMFSYDYGRSWSIMHTELINEFSTCYMIVENAHFYGTSDGVYLSTDNGNTWSLQSQGLPAFKSFTSKLTGLYLYLDTLYLATGEGLFKAGLEDFGIHTSAEEPNSRNDFFVYPNPATNETNIVLATEADTDTEYEIIDFLGSKVLNGTIPARSLSCQICLDPLPAGVYFLVTKHGTHRLVKI